MRSALGNRATRFGLEPDELLLDACACPEELVARGPLDRLGQDTVGVHQATGLEERRPEGGQ